MQPTFFAPTHKAYVYVCIYMLYHPTLRIRFTWRKAMNVTRIDNVQQRYRYNYFADFIFTWFHGKKKIIRYLYLPWDAHTNAGLGIIYYYDPTQS